MKLLIGIIVALFFSATVMVYHGKVSGLEVEVSKLEKEVKLEQTKTQAIIEEYNELQKLYDDGQRNKDKLKEKTESAKAIHRNTGTVTRASESDYQLLQQRSREVRGETTGASGKPN